MTESSNRVAVITGAAKGIGRALVSAFLKRGFAVVAVVRSESDVAPLQALSPRVLSTAIDVTAGDAQEQLNAFLDAHVENVDVLVNNAGFGATAYGVEGLKFEELDRNLQVHCYGPIRCVRACLPFMRKSNQSVIVNMSSRFASNEWVATATVPPDQATYPYRIAKAAMNMLTCCLAVELADDNIRVLAVDPGKVKTRFGPRDADTEPDAAAEGIVELIESTSHTGVFIRATGELVPW